MLMLFLLMAAAVSCGFAIGSRIIAGLPLANCFEAADKAIIATWLGILVLANTFFAATLVSALTPAIVVSITATLVLPLFLSRGSRARLKESAGNISPAPLFGATALTLGVAAYCSQVIVWYDTRLYHMQAIKWLSEYGLVPGMGLIHARFGYPSSWFGLAAAMNHGMLRGRIGSVTGGICLLLLVGHFLIALMRIITGRAKHPDLFIALASFLALCVVMIYGLPNSPAPDLPVIILAIETAWCFLTISTLQQNGADDYDNALSVRVIPLLLAAGAVAIKLSALPLLAVAGCHYLFQGKFKPGKLLVTGSILLFFLTPLATAGLITSGCAFYPLATFCTDVAWSLGAAQASAEANLIRDWARWGGRPTPDGATSWNWIVPWFAEEKLCSLLLALSASALVMVAIRHRRRKAICWSSYAVALALGGIVFMFFAAPNWRFGLGYLVILPSLAAASSLPWFIQRSGWLQGKTTPTSWGWIGGITAAVIATHIYVIPRPTFRPLEDVVSNPSVTGNDRPHFNVILPPRIWNIQFEVDGVSGRKTVAVDAGASHDSVGDFTYYRPDNPENSELCGDAPLPCAPGKLSELRLREPGRGIAGGFVKAGVTRQ